MRKPLVVGNWKMNGSLAANKALIQSISAQLSADLADLAVCPPAVFMAQVQDLLSGSVVSIGAQDVSVAESGAYTGQCSATMLAELGCHFVIVGHSERRQYQGETNAEVAAKAAAALASGLTPIVCVGETQSEREAGQALTVIGEQLQAVIDSLSSDQLAHCVVAYEPVWAIGTGLTASPEQAQEIHAAIRQQLAAAGDSVKILYGGSVKANNAAELFAKDDIDGALVGGASLVADDFIAIAASFQS